MGEIHLPRPTASHQREELRRYMAPRWYIAGRAELRSLGFHVHRIDNWVRSGHLVPVFPSVYSLARDLETREALWRASILTAGHDAVLTGRSACELLGFTSPRRDLPRYVQVAARRGRSRTIRGTSPATGKTWLKIVRRELGQEELTNVQGLSVVKAPMALIDLAEKAPEREVFFAFLEACRLGMFDREEVQHTFNRASGRRGASKIKPLVAMWIPELSRTKSVFEGEFLLAWLEDGWPMPLVNVKVHGREVDEYWPQIRFGLELDGRSFHSDPMSVARDLEKVRYLNELGIRVLRVALDEFRADPTGVVRWVAHQAGFA